MMKMKERRSELPFKMAPVHNIHHGTQNSMDAILACHPGPGSMHTMQKSSFFPPFLLKFIFSA